MFRFPQNQIHMTFHKAFKLNGQSFRNSEALLVYCNQWSQELHSFLREWLNECSELKVMTSGSTGLPKEVRLRKEHMKNSAKATGSFLKLGANTKALLCLSPNYIAGKMMLVRAMELGWDLDIVRESSSPLSQSDKVYDFVAMVPLQLSNSLQFLHRVKIAIVGGAPVSSKLCQSLQNASCIVYATYGMTETTSHIALKRLNQNQSKKESEVYCVLPEVNISVDHRGCLVVDANRVASNRITTNDLVEIVTKKTFHWLGRQDNVVNSGGIKLFPEQIEFKLAEIISQRFFVAGLSDDTLGEKLVLLIEGNGKSMLRSIEVKEFLKNANLSKFEYPKEIHFVTTFEETGTNKILRKRTLEMI
jgi:O-succinylbenzoic acid--CoA ligase